MYIKRRFGYDSDSDKFSEIKKLLRIYAKQSQKKKWIRKCQFWRFGKLLEDYA